METLYTYFNLVNNHHQCASIASELRREHGKNGSDLNALGIMQGGPHSNCTGKLNDNFLLTKSYLTWSALFAKTIASQSIRWLLMHNPTISFDDQCANRIVSGKCILSLLPEFNFSKTKVSESCSPSFSETAAHHINCYLSPLIIIHSLLSFRPIYFMMSRF